MSFSYTQYLKHWLTVPFIYLIAVPLVLLHLVLELYHTLCFPLYGLPYVNRKKYLRIDRHHLSYLDWVEKVNCVYCGYANGLLGYASAIAAETERYWCPSKHKPGGPYQTPSHHSGFATFGDAEEYKQKIANR